MPTNLPPEYFAAEQRYKRAATPQEKIAALEELIPSVIDLAERIHKDFADHFKYACIWGSAKFDGQRVQKDYVLYDRDVVEYHLK